MLLVHSIELSVNNKQATYFAKACGIARFSYNWALNEWKKQYALGLKPKEHMIRKSLNAIKAEKFPWMLEVTKVAPQQAIKNLGLAFNRFFNHISNYPKFKKKGVNESFRADNGPATKGSDAVIIKGKKIQLPKIGWIKLKEYLRFKGQVKSVTISKRANRWYAAVSVETNSLPHERKNHGSVGVDLGVKALATLSDGSTVIGAKAHSKLLSKLQRLSRQLSKKVLRSKNFTKAKTRLSILHARIRNIRIDALHKLTTHLVLNNTKISIEDLNVKGMLANRKLSRHIMDQSFYEFRRQLNYKSSWYGSELVIVDRFYPSSKLCNVCGHKNDKLTLSDRYWQCICGITHDRDINAAKNIQSFSSTVSSTGAEVSKTSKACGAASSGFVDVPQSETSSDEAGI